MAEIDPVILRLQADVGKYRADIDATTRRVNSQLDSQGKSVKRLEAQFRASSSQISSSMKGLAASLAAGFGVGEVAKMADSYTRFTNQLKVAGLEGQNLAGVQDRLFKVAQQNGVELESVGTLYSRASQNQRELGASTEDLIGLTRSVAASLRISGTSTNEASGALLQLGQALGSPRIQAEEFNSLLDTMQPLLREASKYIDGTGDSLSGLTRKIKDTSGPGVSNVELFRAITQATAALEDQAGNAALTISAAFTNLSNSMTKYIGEADAANGASAVLVEAISLLAENLDVVTEAIGVLAAVMVGRFAAGMVAGAISTGATSTAIFALQARAAGAATTMEVLALTSRAAGASMLAAFGGPVGLAVTALAIGIGYVASSSAKTKAAADSLSNSIEGQSAKFSELKQNQATVADETDNLTSTQRAAITATANLTGEAGLLANAWARVAAQAKAASVEQANATLMDARRNVNEARGARQSNIRGTKSLEAFQASPNVIAAAKKTGEELRKQYVEAAQNVRIAKGLYDKEVARGLATFKPATSGSPAVAASEKKGGTTGSSPAAKDVTAIANRFQDDMAAAELELKQALADAIGTAEARRDLEADRIEAERQSRERQIKADKDTDSAQKAVLLELNNKVAAARLDAINANALAEATQKNKEATENSARYSQNALEAQLRITDSRTDALAIEQRILSAMEQEESARLEAAILAGQIVDATKARADLASAQSSRRTGVDREYASPLERRRNELRDEAANMGDAIDEIEVDAMDRLGDSIANAATQYIKLGGIAGDVINGIIQDLIKLAARQATLGILNSIIGAVGGAAGGLSNAGGGFGGSADFSTPLSFRAAGGPVVGGAGYIVGENGPEYFRPNGSGTIINNRMLKQGVSGGSQTTQQVTNYYGPGAKEFWGQVDSRAAAVSTPIARGSAAEAGATAYSQSMKDAPGAMRRAQRFRTT